MSNFMEMSKEERDALAKERSDERRAQIVPEKLDYLDKRVPKRYHKHYEHAYMKKSMASAIKANCLDCVCWEKGEVAKCELKHCTFWEYRPYKN